MKTIKALAQLLLLLSSLAVCTVRADTLLDVTDQIAAGDPTQLGRLSRNGVLQDWFGSESFPGVFNAATSYRYRTYSIPVGLTPYVQVMLDSTSTNIFASAYITAYTPGSGLATNWLGDAGTSGNFFGVDPLYFNTVGTTNGTLVVVVNETTPGAGVGAPYRLIVEGYTDANFSAVVLPGGITLVSNNNPAAAGSPITLTATVTGTVTPPSGIVRFDDAGTAIPGCEGTLLFGSGLSRTAQCVTTLSPGSHTVRATFLPDARSGTSQVSDPLTQVVESARGDHDDGRELGQSVGREEHDRPDRDGHGQLADGNRRIRRRHERQHDPAGMRGRRARGFGQRAHGRVHRLEAPGLYRESVQGLDAQ